MAAATIVSTVLIEDLLYEVNPDLDAKPPAFVKALTAVLRPALNRVVKACATPEAMNSVIARERERVAVYRTTAGAFDLFVHNMTTGD
jgi:hypothetical protein